MWLATPYSSMVNLDHVISIDHTHDDDDGDAIVANNAYRKDCEILFRGSTEDCKFVRYELQRVIRRGPKHTPIMKVRSTGTPGGAFLVEYNYPGDTNSHKKKSHEVE